MLIIVAVLGYRMLHGSSETCLSQEEVCWFASWGGDALRGSDGGHNFKLRKCINRVVLYAGKDRTTFGFDGHSMSCSKGMFHM